MKEPSRFPPWLKRSISGAGSKSRVELLIEQQKIHTVCSEAKCPNRCECFSHGTATFLILGDVCTRSCGFCGVTHGSACAPDPDEPRRVAAAAVEMGLSYVVITSVTRDDLPDGGASQFADTICALKTEIPIVRVEVLIPDFRGSQEALETVLMAKPDVLNHNIETVPRLYSLVRSQADYRRSLQLLRRASTRSWCRTKSGLMVGLGETQDEVLAVIRDIRETGCTMLTIGQYLQPSREQLSVARFVTPGEFERYRQEALGLGFAHVSSGPFVRSSYHASEAFDSEKPCFSKRALTLPAEAGTIEDASAGDQ